MSNRTRCPILNALIELTSTLPAVRRAAAIGPDRGRWTVTTGLAKFRIGTHYFRFN
jgi:hypothetical protein